jgi:hypothetical protein
VQAKALDCGEVKFLLRDSSFLRLLGQLSILGNSPKGLEKFGKELILGPNS